MPDPAVEAGALQHGGEQALDAIGGQHGNQQDRHIDAVHIEVTGHAYAPAGERPASGGGPPGAARTLADASAKSASRKPCTTCAARCAKSEEHTSELQSLMRISSAVFCLTKKTLLRSQYPD